jgi:hypothetical protein
MTRSSLTALQRFAFLCLLGLSAAVATALTWSAPVSAADASEIIGHWRTSPFRQETARMAPQCARITDVDSQVIPESELDIFDCNDPKYAQVKERILTFIRQVNPIYRAQGHPLYSEKISGLCAVVVASQAKYKEDVCNPSEKLRGAPIQGLPVIWNIRKSNNGQWPLMGDSYSPSSGYGAISCIRPPVSGKIQTKGCRRWTVELPFVGSQACDCGCSAIVCDQYTWQRK